MNTAAHLLELFYLFLAASLLGWLFRRFQQPTVIGQMLAGILVGPALLGLVHEGEILEFLAEMGAVFLLFRVGLEIRFKDILSVGREAFSVAIIGVALPFLGGYLYGGLIGFAQLPALFLGTALVATSVGITAAVLQELGVLSRSYSRIILGAAVIDDILGLIVLAIVSGVAQAGVVDVGSILKLSLLSLAFVGGAALLISVIRHLPLDRIPNPYSFALVWGLGLSALSAAIGLAPIVGAFLAGMILAEVREQHDLDQPVAAVESFLAPIFFAMVGVRLELAVFGDLKILAAGAMVSLIAILGKLLGGLGALTQGLREMVLVGTGMVPRGEVGLIVVAIGLSAGAVVQEEYAIVLFMVVVTTLFAPLALRLLIHRLEGQKERAPEPAPAD